MKRVNVAVDVYLHDVFELMEDEDLIAEMELRGMALEDADNTRETLELMQRAHYLLISGKEAQANAMLQDHMLSVMGRAVV
jgi:hypothetical protein